MPKVTKYTLKQIEGYWKKYNEKTVLRIMKAGKWSTIPLEGKGIPRLTATQAKVVKFKDVMDFPEYLKKIEDDNKPQK